MTAKNRNLFDAIASRLGPRCTPNRDGNHLNCGATDDKTAWFQIKDRGECLEIGLAFDDPKPFLNAKAAAEYARIFAAELDNGNIIHVSGKNQYITEWLERTGEVETDALQACERIRWWIARVDDAGVFVVN